MPPFPSSLAGVAYTTALETVELDAVKAGSINPDEQVNYAVEASACSGYLHVELWDTGRGGLTKPTPMRIPSPMAKTPRASYERDNNDWRFSEDTYVDLEGYRLIRAYHRVVVDMRSCADACARACEGSSAPNCQALCETDCDEPDRDANKPFIVGFTNGRVWVQQTLGFDLPPPVPYVSIRRPASHPRVGALARLWHDRARAARPPGSRAARWTASRSRPARARV